MREKMNLKFSSTMLVTMSNLEGTSTWFKFSLRHSGRLKTWQLIPNFMMIAFRTSDIYMARKSPFFFHIYSCVIWTIIWPFVICLII
jgi:hypothetical protein